jgi:hypothetical protein
MAAPFIVHSILALVASFSGQGSVGYSVAVIALFVILAIVARDRLRTRPVHHRPEADAKRAVAVALRNRWRRKQLADDLRRRSIPRTS